MAKWSKCTGRNMSSTLNECIEERLGIWHDCPCGHPPQQGGHHHTKAGRGDPGKESQVLTGRKGERQRQERN
ncbi:rCG57659, partial [Rattus norvegicus]